MVCGHKKRWRLSSSLSGISETNHLTTLNPTAQKPGHRIMRRHIEKSKTTTRPILAPDSNLLLLQMTVKDNLRIICVRICIMVQRIYRMKIKRAVILCTAPHYSSAMALSRKFPATVLADLCPYFDYLGTIGAFHRKVFPVDLLYCLIGSFLYHFVRKLIVQHRFNRLQIS
jgi:hypothetical protein